ncbi:hypothetical protein AC579_3349 [Pseudocercospora musae]|uniref:Uncharacterized protein n=1 Tax=Pseudocercospora musae TaxID=113226 RepID=A0A139GVI2_9PEZI|nr:hypothetical protein AC579_3349 [Pseudocercospora musae]
MPLLRIYGSCLGLAHFGGNNAYSLQPQGRGASPRFELAGARTSVAHNAAIDSASPSTLSAISAMPKNGCKLSQQPLIKERQPLLRNEEHEAKAEAIEEDEEVPDTVTRAGETHTNMRAYGTREEIEEFLDSEEDLTRFGSSSIVDPFEVIGQTLTRFGEKIVEVDENKASIAAAKVPGAAPTPDEPEAPQVEPRTNAEEAGEAGAEKKWIRSSDMLAPWVAQMLWMSPSP